MVKRQKEKQYQSSVEHRRNSQLRSGSAGPGRSSSTVRPLPFNCCALTLTPFQNPVMRIPNDHLEADTSVSTSITRNGIIFENSAILPYLMKHKADPVTGKPMSSRDLITLQMDKDEETGKWQCPILNKPFLNHTKVVAVISGGRGRGGRAEAEAEAHVYSYEAVYELNIKPKNYMDLITGEKFNRKRDIIVLQDPANVELNSLRDINNFKHSDSFREKSLSETAFGNSSNNVRLSITASRIMDKMKRKRQDDEEAEAEAKRQTDKDKNATSKKLKIFADDVTGVSLTSGKASGSLTSTVMNVINDNGSREATEEEILVAKFDAMKKLKKKGFVRLTIASFGVIDLELHCDIVPRTCMNFIGLVERGSYNGTLFHRSIRNFMIQGGKPKPKSTKSKSKVESSLWGEAFVDEFDDRLKHTGGGILSMANAGANTNKMQFFITYKSAPHLDRKHSVFGRVVKGIDVLRALEDVPTDKKDRPYHEIKIERTEVLYSPIEEAGEKERVRIEKRAEAKRLEKEERRSSAMGIHRQKNNTSNSDMPTREEKVEDQAPAIGKYLSKNIAVGASSSSGNKAKNNTKDEIIVPLSRLPPPPKKTTFGDFSGW